MSKISQGVTSSTLNNDRHSLKVVLFFIASVIISSSIQAKTLQQGSGAVNNEALDPALITLFQLIGERLSYMEAVASYKWHNNLAIEDLEREALVLKKAVSSASSFDLESASAKQFFSVQIAAAKEIQRGWFQHWQKNQSPVSADDLNTEVRPRLIKLGNQILRQIELTQAVLAQKEAQELNTDFLKYTHVEFLSAETQQVLLESLLEIKHLRSPHRLAAILEKGQIRVGTTGDYKPFSFRDPATGELSGIDIDLATNLAKSLGVDVEFVATSWPTLSTDFSKDKFDIAMSGVSINLERQRLGFFSIPYLAGGKTPIALCKHIDRFDTLNKINQPSTRVIVNPGGTNYRFAKSQLTKANLRIFKDNQTIFKQIVAGEADVMVTDAVEVRLQANLEPDLCATMPGKTLTKSEKGYWLPADPTLKEYVDQWLHKRQVEGYVDNVFSRHLKGR